MTEPAIDRVSALMRAALSYAEKGWPVFPLAPGGKLPLFSKEEGGRAYLDATTDLDQIREWWRAHPNANIGIATGAASGIWVLDSDKHGSDDGDASLALLQEQFGSIPETLTQLTPSGGNHRIFKMNGTEIRNRARVAPGIDVRGTGGYIVAPPSIHPNGKPYRWKEGKPVIEAPKWLVDLVARKDEPSPAHVSSKPPEAYAAAAFGRIIGELSRSQEGERNEALNKAAFALGQFIASDSLSRSMCEISLRSTAMALGLPPREADATIKSGIESGLSHPRQAPEDKRPQQKSKSAPVYNMETGEIIEEALPSSDATIPLKWFDEIEPSMETVDFVEGILTHSTLSVIFGEPGCGKTFMVLDMALHVALGQKWMGREVTQGGVLYVALEGQGGFRNRITAFRRHHGLEDAKVNFAAITSSVNLLDPAADTGRLIETIKAAEDHIEQPVVLVVIDTLSRAMAGGEENTPEDMGALVGNAQRIINETGAHVAFVHHSGKDKTKGARGHSSLFGAVDTEIEILRDPQSKVCTCHARKQRDLELHEDFSFELETVKLGFNSRNKPITSCIVTPSDNPECDDPRDNSRQMERIVIEQMHEMMADGRGHNGIVPERGMRPVTAIRRDELRQWLVLHGFLSLDKKQQIDTASRSKLSRAMESLRARKQIGIYEEWVWIAR